MILTDSDNRSDAKLKAERDRIQSIAVKHIGYYNDIIIHFSKQEFEANFIAGISKSNAVTFLEKPKNITKILRITPEAIVDPTTTLNQYILDDLKGSKIKTADQFGKNIDILSAKGRSIGFEKLFTGIEQLELL